MTEQDAMPSTTSESALATIVVAAPPRLAPRRPVPARPSRAPTTPARATHGPLDDPGMLDRFAAQIRDVLWLTTADARELLWLSPAAIRLFGVAPEEIYADPSKGFRLVHPADRAQLVDGIRSSRGAGGVQEFRIRLPDRAIHWIRQHTFAIHGSDGRVRWIAGVAEDVTAQRNAGDRLQRTLRDLATLVPALRRSLEIDGYFAAARAEGRAGDDRGDAERVATCFETLTRRERQVHDLTVRGRSTKEIAATLGCSPKTVAVHRGQMMRKLGVRSIAELVRLHLAREH